MPRRNINSDPQVQNVSVESSPETSKNLIDLAHEVDLDHEVLGDVTVAIERNPDQSLVLLETRNASAAIAIDVSELTLAEVLEETDTIVDELELLARGPVFATDGGER